MEVGKSIELIRHGMLVAVGTVFSVTASDHCHFVLVGEDRLIVQVQRSIVPNSPLPYPNDGYGNETETVSEAVDGFVLWDKIQCKQVGETDYGKRQDDTGISALPHANNDEENEVEEEVSRYADADHGGMELAMGEIVYPKSSVCINGKAVGEENAGILITILNSDVSSSLVQAQLPKFTPDQPHLCAWPIRLLKLEGNGWILGDLYSVYADADYGRHGEQVQEGKEKRHYHSTKRKLLSSEEKSLKKLQKKGSAKLTDDSIRDAIAKRCSCLQECWKNWSIAEIREERSDIYGVKHDQKLDLLFAKIDASKQRNDGMVLFKDGHFVCKKAFYIFHGIAKSSYYAYKNGSLGGAKQGFHGNTGTLKPREKTIHAFSTMKILLEEMSEPMPHLSFDNKGKTGTDDICDKLPSCYTQKDLYSELRIRMEQSGHGTISLSKFYTLWEKSFSNFSFHNRSAFAICTKCEYYKALLTRERNVELRKKYEGEREGHLQLQISGRTNYYSHNMLATSEPNLFKSGIHDGMDSNKTTVPKLANNVKALAGVGMPLLVKIAGILNRGSGPPSCAHVCIGGLWSSDPNFTISSMAKYLRDCENFDGDMRGDLAFSEDLQHPLLQALHNKPIFEKTFLNLKRRRVEDFLNLEIPISSERPFTKLPPTFYIQLDNSGKDNKNWAVMAFLSELATRGVFKTVIASFLIVGHTHKDVDAFFSKINRVLSDYKSHAKPYHQPFTGIRNPIAFKFTMMDNRPIYQYQLKYGDPWLPTFGNTVWKRRDPKSQVDFSVIPPPDREPVDVGMFEKHANAEDISSYLKAYIKHVKSIQEKTSPTSALLSMDQAIGDYWGKILKLLEKGWPSNKGNILKEGFWPRTNHGTGFKRPSDMQHFVILEPDLLGREAGEELEERERPFVGSVLERGMESFTPVLDIHPGHMVIIQPTDDFVPKNVVWLAKAVSIVNREANTTYHNHVKVNWYRPKHKVSNIDDRGRYQNCMRRTQEWEKDPHEYPENETWVNANACIHSWKSQAKSDIIRMTKKILEIARNMLERVEKAD
ncbi:hypothetical protein R1sor_022086 [Riccia sorocarpa]|uniref:Uncharacterized protein n=1 Tax=Riccia sorocarpa TaxID=122646 RepID=A0ABD3GM11_9MARC